MIRRRSDLTYEAVIVLGSGLARRGAHYYPTDYRDSDEHGMFAGGFRIAAAVELFLNRLATRFVFTTGRAPRIVLQFGPDVPIEAEVHERKFLGALAGLRRRSDFAGRFNGLPDPETILETDSSSTGTNIQAVLQLIIDFSWHRVAIVSNDYHIGRARALYEMVLDDHPEVTAEIDFIGAETYLKIVRPGVYDEAIATAYTSAAGRKRLLSESRGLTDIKAGRYVMSHFDLRSSPRPVTP